MQYAEHLGFWSILPVLLAIACAVVTRKVILALFLGVYIGVLTLERGNPITAATSLIRDYLVVHSPTLTTPASSCCSRSSEASSL